MSRSDEKTRAWLDRLEREAREQPTWHTVRLTALVALGYAYPLLLGLAAFAAVVLLMAVAPLAWGAELPVVLLLFVTVVGALVAAAAVFGTLWVTVPPPDGHPLRPEEAPALRALADEVCRAAGAPAIHEIHVDHNFNAAVSQRPRFGFWGRRRNYLIVGVPLLEALAPGPFRAVLAHEAGHLVGRHASFGSWIYRVHRTWAALAGPIGKAGRLRWLLVGWFVKWYGEYFSLATLALRRRHEYEADARIAGVYGARQAGEALAAIASADYRLAREFWPALVREAGRDPLPPADVVGRVARFLSAAPSPGLVGRWRTDERRRRTPIVSSHPCLADRLAALGMRELLDDGKDLGGGDDERTGGLRRPPAPDASAATLLGDARLRATAVANAAWKAMSVNAWRAEHAYARHLAAQAAKPPAADSGAGETAESAWTREQPRVKFADPVEAIDALRQFLTRFPAHGEAAFTLGRLLLERGDEDGAVASFERAMRHDSDTIGPGLAMLLEHYRDAGRDADADPVQRRLAEHESALGRARRERLSVGRRDRFLPHGLPDAEMVHVRRVLARFPQVRAARLVRKEVSLFADKPSYVLAVDRRPGLFEDNGRIDKMLVGGLQAQMPVPCAVVVLGWTSRSLRARLLKACPEPVFVDRA